MKSTFHPQWVRTALASLLAASLALPTYVPAADSSTPPSSAGTSRDLRITPVSDPAVVGVRRASAPGSYGAGAAEAEANLNEPGNATWNTDYSAALGQAAREKKLVLLNFTGSDWCGWCHRLEADVFSKSEFKAYAARHFVLVKVDFPRKTRLPPNEAAQNARLQQQFGVRGFPTIIAVDAAGVKVAEIRG